MAKRKRTSKTLTYVQGKRIVFKKATKKNVTTIKKKGVKYETF